LTDGGGWRVRLDAAGEGAGVEGRMTVTPNFGSFTVDLQCAGTTEAGRTVIAGMTTDSTSGLSPEGAWAAIVIGSEAPVLVEFLAQYGGPGSEAASCLEYLDESRSRADQKVLLPIEGSLDLGPAMQPGGNSK
jgi:hypothetical protein